MTEPLIQKHGGYEGLVSFQMARLAYDVTVCFADSYIDKRSRTRDQMVQAARSGTQNIAEGSQVSGTSKKMELKLTNVARASLEELKLDYQDYLRQRGLAVYRPNDPRLQRYKAQRSSQLSDVLRWVESEAREVQSAKRDELLANAALAIVNLASYLLNRQIASLASCFEKEGGFTERLYKTRVEKRRKAE